MRSSNAVSWAIACGLVLGARVAAGQAPPALPDRWPEAGPAIPIAPAAPVQERWYGWQTLLADAGAVTLTIALTANADERDDAAVIGAFVLGASAFALGAPIVHGVHGHWGKAGVSLALRTPPSWRASSFPRPRSRATSPRWCSRRCEVAEV